MIKILVDCTCEISVAEAKQMGLVCLPMRMSLNDQEYLAGENLDNDQFYQLLATSKGFPKTMQINPDDYVAAIQPLLDAGDEVFAMSISSGLSGTFNSLALAAAQINSPHLKIFDTQTFTLAYYALVREAMRLVADGANLELLYTSARAAIESAICA